MVSIVTCRYGYATIPYAQRLTPTNTYYVRARNPTLKPPCNYCPEQQCPATQGAWDSVAATRRSNQDSTDLVKDLDPAYSAAVDADFIEPDETITPEVSLHRRKVLPALLQHACTSCQLHLY